MMLNLLIIALLSTGVLGEPLWNALLQKFSSEPDDGYFPFPRELSEAEADGWVQPPDDTTGEEYGTTLRCYHEDAAMCLLYDRNGFIAGASVALFTEMVDNCSSFSFHKAPFVPATRFNHSIYTITAYFVEPEYLAEQGRDNLDEGTGTGLWFVNGTEIIRIPRNEADMANTTYAKQNCNDGMGVHYYSNVFPEMDCETFYPLFAIYKHHQLIGYGMHTFGAHPVFPNSRDWYDFALPEWAKLTLPNSDDCIVEVSRECGINSYHFFFIDDARQTRCPV